MCNYISTYTIGDVVPLILEFVFKEKEIHWKQIGIELCSPFVLLLMQVVICMSN